MGVYGWQDTYGWGAGFGAIRSLFVSGVYVHLARGVVQADFFQFGIRLRQKNKQTLLSQLNKQALMCRFVGSQL